MATIKDSSVLQEQFKEQIEKLDKFVKSIFPENNAEVYLNIYDGTIDAKIYIGTSDLYED